MIHYAETHDNPRLAGVSNEYARMRTALSALSSVSGAFGFTNGVEFFAREKIDVHEDCALNWGSAVNQVDFIGRLNCILRSHPSFRNGAFVRCIDSGSGECVLIARSAPDGSSPLLIAVNLDTKRSVQALWNIHSAPFRSEKAFDLLDTSHDSDLGGILSNILYLGMPGEAERVLTVSDVQSETT